MRPDGGGPGAAEPFARDRIEVRGLRVLGRHGALPGEQDVPQPFEIDIVVEADLGRASTSDDLRDTLDYAAVSLSAAEVVATRRFALLEALAATIAELVLSDPRAAAVTVTVRKLRPPIPADLSSVGVSVSRRRR